MRTCASGRRRRRCAISGCARARRSEIRDYLHRKGYSPETVDTAVGRLTERGYLDDLAFARWWAENRAQFRPRGPHLFRQELRRKGVASETIDETLATQAETIDTDAQALALARGKLRSFHKNGLEADVIYRRLSGLLARRGYGYDTSAPSSAPSAIAANLMVRMLSTWQTTKDESGRTVLLRAPTNHFYEARVVSTYQANY